MFSFRLYCEDGGDAGEQMRRIGNTNNINLDRGLLKAHSRTVGLDAIGLLDHSGRINAIVLGCRVCVRVGRYDGGNNKITTDSRFKIETRIEAFASGLQWPQNRCPLRIQSHVTANSMRQIVNVAKVCLCWRDAFTCLVSRVS